MKKGRTINRWIRFALILLAAGVVGGVIGFLSIIGIVLVDVKSALTLAEQWMIEYATPLLIGGTVILIGAALLLFIDGYRRYTAGEQEEDNQRSQSGDIRMNIGIGITTLVYVWDFFIIGTAFGAERISMMCLLVFLICSIGVCIVQVKMIDQVKKIMPEKRGDATRINFQEEWLDSCDEAEQYMIFKASYRTYMITQKALLFLWVLCALARLMLGVGMSALIAVSVIWTVQTITYTAFCVKYSAEKLN